MPVFAHHFLGTFASIALVPVGVLVLPTVALASFLPVPACQPRRSTSGYSAPAYRAGCAGLGLPEPECRGPGIPRVPPFARRQSGLAAERRLRVIVPEIPPARWRLGVRVLRRRWWRCPNRKTPPLAPHRQRPFRPWRQKPLRLAPNRAKSCRTPPHSPWQSPGIAGVARPARPPAAPAGGVPRSSNRLRGPPEAIARLALENGVDGARRPLYAVKRHRKSAHAIWASERFVVRPTTWPIRRRRVSGVYPEGGKTQVWLPRPVVQLCRHEYEQNIVGLGSVGRLVRSGCFSG